LAKFKRIAPPEALRDGRAHVIGYVGIMDPQDGVDLFINAMAHLVGDEGRRDVKAVIVGAGTELAALQARAAAAGLEDHVTFTGFLSGEALLSAFPSFDIVVILDPKNSYNNKISMNKHCEYMTPGIPIVQFDLVEGRRIASDCSLYARDNSPRDLARQLGRLVDDVALRAKSTRRSMAWLRTTVSGLRSRM
jgi:glycosyltransferase involved in cell wall biosynthesis